MKPEEYDALIDDPTGFLWNVWLPRVAAPVRAPGEPATMESNAALVKGAMAMGRYFGSFGNQIARLRAESGTVSAIAGIFKAPMDILADKLRGYLGLVEDLFERRDKVLRACEALMPHLYHVAKTTADPERLVPIGYWMHRGGVPFVKPEIFRNVYWATAKPIIEELWADGHQTLFYAEGKWDFHLESFAELPARSIVYHVDQGDIFKAKQVLGDKFCISGGIPNVLLARGTTQDGLCLHLADLAVVLGYESFRTRCIRSYASCMSRDARCRADGTRSVRSVPGTGVQLNWRRDEPVSAWPPRLVSC
jgi:hypothetical protein